MPHPLLKKQAPHFSAKAVKKGEILEEFSLRDYLGKYIFFFFYPLDFTFVCPTELHAFQAALPEFHKRGAEVIACSVDSWYSHLAWLSIPKDKGGIEGVEYPIVSDFHKSIARSYGVLEEDSGVAFRGQFLIDRQGVVRHSLVNDLPIGRSVEEALRLLDAIISYEMHGEVCPAGWRPGARTMKPTQEGLENYFSAGDSVR